jgi:hypothetical protein
MAVPPNESSATLNATPPARAPVPIPELPVRFEDELRDFIRVRGFEPSELSHDVRIYGDDDSPERWSTHVFSITLPGADRPARSGLMLELLDYLGEHEDERVRKGVTVRVR